MQVNTTMSYLYTLTRMVEIKKTNSIECWWEGGATGTLIHRWCEYKKVHACR